MTETEIEVITLIRNHNDPGQALNVALKLMFDFLEKHEEPQDTFSVHPRVSA